MQLGIQVNFFFSKKINKFREYITIKTPVKAAELKNNAGIVGAAIFAKKQLYNNY